MYFSTGTNQNKTKGGRIMSMRKRSYLIACVLFEYNRVLPPSYSENFSSFSDFEKDPDDDAKRFVNRG